MEGSIYSNFQVSNPKNEIRIIFGLNRAKIAFLAQKGHGQKLTQKLTLK